MARTRDGFTDMDWDKLKVFHAAAEAGSFTHAGEQLGLSQSAVSRQVSALEQELSVSLFHRHARGLILTEQGDLLFRTAHDVFMQLQAARAKLTDSRERPSGDLKITTTPGVGINWLIPRLGEFTALYPEIRISLIVTDEELDLSMREADVAIRTRKPTQPDLIQRKLPCLLFAGIHQTFRYAAHPRRTRRASHHHAERRTGRAASAEPQLADRGRPQWLRSAGGVFQGQ
jgi:DNA-binding transcriptional LysR family regulator